MFVEPDALRLDVLPLVVLANAVAANNGLHARSMVAVALKNVFRIAFPPFLRVECFFKNETPAESITSQEHRYTRTRSTRREQRAALLIIILEMVDRFCKIKAT